MFEKIVAAAKACKTNRALIIEKRNLNAVEFTKILNESPRLLFIMCHGIPAKQTEVSFLFENPEKPYLLEKFSKTQVSKALVQGGSQYKIDAIVLSTCFSEELGKIFLEHLNPVPAIVAINAREPVLSDSTFTFNPGFLEQLMRSDTSIKNAYEEALKMLNSSQRADSICCC